jgi:hypothetical protein
MHVLYEFLFGPQQPIWVSDLSNLTVFGLLASAVGFYKRFNCTEKGCWRIGHERVQGTTFRTCRHHTTRAVHDRLHLEHAQKYPEQHEILNAQSGGNPAGAGADAARQG